jgi:two-component system, NarL family, nitrate/nitrite response regulator NarL
MIRAFVVAAVCLYREGLAMILDQQAGIDVVGTASDAAEAIVSLRTLERRADIVLVDVSEPEAISGIGRIRRAAPGTSIVAVTVPDAEHEVIACAEAGVVAYVTREGSHEDLIATVVHASRGEALSSPAMTAALLHRISVLAGRAQGFREGAVLTPRELQIAELIEQGLANKQIAARLQVELPTVKNHVHRILEKLGVHRRAEAAAWVRAGGAGMAAYGPRS